MNKNREYVGFGEVRETFTPLAECKGTITPQYQPLLKWTSDRPTIEGFYWVKDWRNTPEIVYFLDDRHIASMANEDIGAIKDYQDYEWAGPLEPPKG